MPDSHTKIPCAILHVGYPKCASTFLQKEILPTSDGVYLFREKHHLLAINRMRSASLAYDRRAFVRLFREDAEQHPGKRLVVSHEGFMGSMHNGVGARFIISELDTVFDPEHVLLVIKDQVDYLYSAWSHFIREGGSMSFAKFLAHPASPAVSQGQAGIISRLMYDRYVGHLQRVFGAERVHVLLVEDFRDSPEAVKDAISAMLGLPVSWPARKTRHHASLTVAGSNLKRMANMLFDTPWAAMPCGVLPGHPRARHFFEKRFPKLGPRDARPYTLKHVPGDVQDIIRKSNRALARLLERDLSEEGYLV